MRIGKLWGYIDKQGAMMIAPRFDSASSFSGGLGLVSADGLFGYVDRTGSFAIRRQFNHAESSADGRAWAISHPVNGTSIIAVSKLSPENSLSRVRETRSPHHCEERACERVYCSRGSKHFGIKRTLTHAS